MLIDLSCPWVIRKYPVLIIIKVIFSPEFIQSSAICGYVNFVESKPSPIPMAGVIPTIDVRAS